MWTRKKNSGDALASTNEWAKYERIKNGQTRNPQTQIPFRWINLALNFSSFFSSAAELKYCMTSRKIIMVAI